MLCWMLSWFQLYLPLCCPYLDVSLTLNPLYLHTHYLCKIFHSLIVDKKMLIVDALLDAFLFGFAIALVLAVASAGGASMGYNGK
jgi:hypothetical protein